MKSLKRLTVTKVVFEYETGIQSTPANNRLTVTKVVFEYDEHIKEIVFLKINSNKGCF